MESNYRCDRCRLPCFAEYINGKNIRYLSIHCKFCGDHHAHKIENLNIPERDSRKKKLENQQSLF